MTLGRFSFKFEPAVWLGLARAVFPALVIFGYVQWTPEQIAQVVVTTEAVATFIQRSVVTPNAKLQPETVAQAKEVPPGPKP